MAIQQLRTRLAGGSIAGRRGQVEAGLVGNTGMVDFVNFRQFSTGSRRFLVIFSCRRMDQPRVLTVFSDSSSRAPWIVLNGIRISSLIPPSLGAGAVHRRLILEALRPSTACGRDRLVADLSL